MKQTSRTSVLCHAAMLAASLMVCAGPTAAVAADASAATAPVEARDILAGMGAFLAGTPRFSVNVQSSYEAVQPSGAKIEFASDRRATVVRPDRLRVESREGNGDADVLTFDGRILTLSRPTEGIYAQSEKAGDIDGAVVHFVRDLRMRLPLAMLLLSRLPQELERRVTAVDYVEKTTLAGATVHHLAGSTDSVDFQVWVKDGGEPLPVRVTITYRDAEGQPSFRADLTSWNLNPAVNESMFKFTPAKDARKIAFLSQVQGAVAKEEGK